MGRRIDVEPHNVAELLGEMLVVGQLELADPMRLKAMPAPDALHRGDADAGRLGHRRRRPVGHLARRFLQRPGHDAGDDSAPSGGIRDGRVLSRRSPSTPSCTNRSCQRQITVLALPVRA